MARTQGRFARRTVVSLAGLSGLTLLVACGGGGGGGGSTTTQVRPCEEFDCKGLVENLGNNVMLPTFREFQVEAQDLSQAIDQYRAALGTADEAAAQQAAQQAWRDAMAVWQRAEVMQVGPLSDNSYALRNVIYSWPTTSSCGVDQDVVFADSGKLPDGTTYDISTRTPERRGLDALEYVLFEKSLLHSCPDNVTVVQDWNGRSESERKAARATYAALAAADVARQAQTVVARWDGTEDDFLRELTEPGTADSRFADAQAAVNAVSDALFYVEKQTKDEKLAKPAGIKDNACGPIGTVCPAEVEAPFSNASKSHIKNNLASLQTLFLGNAPDAVEDRLGFDDYLATMGDVNVSSAMETDIRNALSAIDNIPGSLADAVDTNIESVEAAHEATKLVTDRLKNDFLEVLWLSIPNSAAGDGD